MYSFIFCLTCRDLRRCLRDQDLLLLVSGNQWRGKMNTRACSPDNILEHGRMGVKPKCKDCYAYLKNAQKLNSFQILKTGSKYPAPVTYFCPFKCSNTTLVFKFRTNLVFFNLIITFHSCICNYELFFCVTLFCVT